MNRIGFKKYSILVVCLLVLSCCKKPDPLAPVKPTNVYAGDHELGFGVYWTDEGENAQGFKVFRSVNSELDFTEYADVPYPENKFYLDLDVSGMNYYSYQVMAYNNLGESDLSEPAVVPKAPRNPKYQIKDKAISFSWDKPEDSKADGIVLDRSIDDTLNFKPVNQVKISVGAIQDDSVSQGNDYYYRIRSYADQVASQQGLSLPSKTFGPLTATSGETGFFEDERDGKIYAFVEIGKQVWMAENLNFETTNGSWCYQKSSTNCKSYGRLYNWSTATSNFGNGTDICPKGWHLPTDNEWKQLERQLGMPEEDIEKDRFRKGGEIGRKLKTEEGWSSKNGDNSSGFSARPAGFKEMFGGFKDLGIRTSWWTATKTNVLGAYRRWITPSTGIGRYNSYQAFGFSVRCLKDE